MNEQVDQQRWIRMDQEAYEVPEAYERIGHQEQNGSGSLESL